MRNLLRFIINYQFALLFLIIEIISISLVVRGNKYQQARYINFSQNINGYFSKKINNFLQYFSLTEINTQLFYENGNLKNELENLKESGSLNIIKKLQLNDTLNKQQYTYVIAKVINNSVNKQYNFITLDKGSLDGLKPDMAVISQSGAIGKVESVSEHYALVMSVLNRNLKISAKIKKNNYFGSFEWSGISYRTGSLNEIPLHVKLSKGDTIITTGFSSIFPAGILVGYISDFSILDGSFYKINVRIANDFKNLYYVYVLTNHQKEEQQLLENLYKHD
jgi:rod shape-determining protein MreC